MARAAPPNPLLVMLALIGGIAAASVIGLRLLHELELDKAENGFLHGWGFGYALVIGIGAWAGAVLLKRRFRR